MLKSFLPSGIRSWLRRLERQWLVTLVERDNASGGFALIGDARPRAHYQRIYLACESGTRARRMLNLHTEHSLINLAKSYGLVVFSGIEAPQSLRYLLIEVPRFVDMTVDLLDSEEVLYRSLHESARYDVRKSRDFQLEVHSDVSWSEEFFYRYHEPSIIQATR
jgi:hypothetical protein